MRLTESEMEGVRWHLPLCPTYESRPWVSGPPVSQRRVAVIATSGVHMPNDRPFRDVLPGGGETYRVIPGDANPNELVISHGEITFDRTGFQQDGNMIFPLDRLRELAAEGVIGSVADFHYSFGARMSTEELEMAAREIAGLLRRDKVDAALMCAPV